MKIENFNECCGCAACLNKCPKNAIVMKENEQGFLYPIIDKNKCISCGLCEKVCPMLNKLEPSKEQNQKFYAVKHKEEKIREASSSGGVFNEIAELFLKNNGVIYGAVFTDDFKVKHIRAEDRSGKDKMRGSKYVQSDIQDVYENLKKDLEGNRKVLFSGTPCQIVAIKKYLGKEDENLTTCDIICHGVPSPKVFKEYLEMQSRKFDSKINSVSFRSKKIKGFVQSMEIEFKNGKRYLKKLYKDLYGYSFLNEILMRNSCFNCPYSYDNRVGDITLGDFWGIEHVVKNFDDKKGVSLVIVNNDKGKKIFNEIKENFNFVETNKEESLKYNRIGKLTKSKDYDKFWKKYERIGISYLSMYYYKKYVGSIPKKILEKMKVGKK